MAGGHGQRLRPATLALNKHLLIVFDKPMIYYPLSTLMLAGIRETTIIVPTGQVGTFRALLGDGSQFGISIRYVEQYQPTGIADAFRLTMDDLGGSSIGLALGDNILHGQHLGRSMAFRESPRGAQIFAYQVRDPRPYAVVEISQDGTPLSLQEKPELPRSSWAVPGLYFYPPDVFEVAPMIKPSQRGELEITDINRFYLSEERLDVMRLPRGTVWFDGGTPETLLEASGIISGMFERQGLAIGSPEEIAWRNGWIDTDSLRHLANSLQGTSYGTYLYRLADSEDPPQS